MHQRCSCRSAVAFPQFPPVDAVVGDEIQRPADVRQLFRVGSDGAWVDVLHGKRADRRAVATPQFVTALPRVCDEKQDIIDRYELHAVGNERSAPHVDHLQIDAQRQALFQSFDG
jgi:hypothetical protein